ncbi:MAG: hypothetical protein P8Q90_04705 [Candidatus Thalassarchaeaceae archaeon]|nr:hypothetical protein [Candidatus Thalassarchaeaceae archaeon]
MSSEQFDLLVEVKCAPISTSISLSERDLAGIRVDLNSSDIGALAVLNDHSSYHCSMVFIEIQDIPQSMIGTTAKSELPPSSDDATLAYISSRWEDWILRSGAIENVFEDEHSRISENIEHYLRIKYAGSSLPPVESTKTRGMDVQRRLKRLRSEGGTLHEKPKKEGFLHQYILYHIISTDGALGCTRHRNNPVGVPDIEARINRLD